MAPGQKEPPHATVCQRCRDAPAGRPRPIAEAAAEAMHGLSRRLASTRTVEKILEVAGRYISEIFDGDVLAMLPDEKHKLRVAAGDMSSVIQHDVLNHMNVARSAFETGRMAGWGTGSSPKTEVLYVPLQAGDTP